MLGRAVGTHGSQGTGEVTPLRTHPYLVGEKALIAGGPGTFSGFFIPGFPKLLRFQGHHELILDKAFPRLKKYLASKRCPEALSPLPRAGMGASRALPKLPRVCCPVPSPAGSRGTLRAEWGHGIVSTWLHGALAQGGWGPLAGS